MKYQFKNTEYVSVVKRKMEMTYSTVADNLEEAIENFHKQHGFSRPWLRSKLNEF